MKQSPPTPCVRSWHPGSLLVLVLLVLLWLLFGADSELRQWLGGALAQPGTVVLLAALYTLPGWALLRLLWPADEPLDTVVAWGLALGLSVVLPPLLLLLASLLHLPWNAAATWAYLLLSAAVLLWPTGPEGRGSGLWGGRWWWQRLRDSAPPVLLVAVLLLVLVVRLFAVRELPTGLLGDSYHHTLIAQLLVEQRGLFTSWQPYTPLVTFTYHFGFHANAAFAHWISGASLPLCVLWVGQLLNALAVALVAALTVALGGNLTGGLWAAVLAGFVLTLPGHFVNWGRYTQLTGQVVLLTTLLCWQVLALRVGRQATQPTAHGWLAHMLQTSRANGRLLLLAALTSAAMVLTHYRVVVFAALFILLLLLACIVVGRSPRLLVLLLFQATLVGLLALLIAAPWLATLLEGYLVRNTMAFVSGAVGSERIAAVARIPDVHPLFVRNYVLVALVGGLLLAAWRREWRMLLPVPWALLLVLCVIPGVVGLPGSGVIDFLTAFGTLYLVVVPPAAYLLAALSAALLRRLRLPVLPGAALLLTGVVCWGTADQAYIVQGNTQLVTPADMQAMAWIREHTPPAARFVVNSFPAYGGTLVAGTDAGWWLPLLAQRASTLPPITYGSERSADPTYSQQVNELAAFLRERPLSDATPVQIDLSTPAALARLRAEGVTHVYSGAQAFPPPQSADWIDTERLQSSPAFEQVYAKDGVQIFRLRAEGRR